MEVIMRNRVPKLTKVSGEFKKYVGYLIYTDKVCLILI